MLENAGFSHDTVASSFGGNKKFLVVSSIPLVPMAVEIHMSATVLALLPCNTTVTSDTSSLPATFVLESNILFSLNTLRHFSNPALAFFFSTLATVDLSILRHLFQIYRQLLILPTRTVSGP